MKNNQKNSTSRLLFIVLLLILSNLSLTTALDKSVQHIGADYLFKAGITGKYQTICVIDDGIDYTHPNLGGCTQAQFLAGNCNKIISGYDFADNDADPIGRTSHGTQVAGIIGSDHDKYKGVASDSKIVAIKVFRDDGQDTNAAIGNAIRQGIRWCVDNSTKFNVSVISISTGIQNLPQGYSEANCPDSLNLSFEIDNAIKKDIAVVAASGNDGFLTGLTEPACLRNVTSVGASDEPDELWGSSNVGQNLDLLAPGVRITSTLKGGGFKSIFGEIICILPTGFFMCYNTGTSFAAPHVAGAFALLYEYDTALKRFEAEQMLKSEGVEVSDWASGLTFKRIDLLKALHVLDWPTENHDFRRTGFTLLKGDMDDQSDISKIDFVMEPGAITGQEQVVKAIVADADGNGDMETVSFVHKTTQSNQTKIYAVEVAKEKKKYEKGYKQAATRKWSATLLGKGQDGGAAYFPGTLANIDSDAQKELITGVRNGTIYAYDITAGGTSISQRWAYSIPPKYSPLAVENRVRFDGGNAVVDIDLDGTNEIVFADVFESDKDWPGEVYVLKDNGAGSAPTKWANKTFGNGGAYATVSIANIDSDDNPEIIVPSMYGIYVFDYNASAPSKLSTKWNNTDGRIESSAIIADVDNDNQYEIVYTTSTASCVAGKNCYNRTYVRDANTGTLERQIDLTTLPRPTPTIANLDSDANLEIVVLTQDSLSGGAVYGDVYCFDAVTGSSCGASWPFNDGNALKTSFMSPNIADIDNDGNYNIVFAENDGNRVFVLKNDGTQLFNYKFEGFIDNGIAIADVDNDGVAELAIKRAGSPVTLFTIVSSTNTPPALESVINLTAIAGELINLTADADIRTSDPNGNVVNVTYSAPFNSSGLWQTSINDTGNYTILVEASDGNLTDYKYVDIMVFNENTSVQNKFSDGSYQTVLTFPSSGNQTIQVRLPKNATVVYSKITVEGTYP